jgi:osomolarity two-component system response regulator SSK1
MKKKKIKFGVANNGLEAVEMWKTGGFHLILVSCNIRSGCA